MYCGDDGAGGVRRAESSQGASVAVAGWADPAAATVLAAAVALVRRISVEQGLGKIMRSMIIAVACSVAYLAFVSVYIKEMRRLRLAGQVDRAKSLKSMIIVIAIPLVIIPWSRVL